MEAIAMRKSRFTEEHIIGILKQAETGMAVAALCRQHGMSDAVFYKWRSKYGGLDVSEARRLRGLEEENQRVKRLVAELVLDTTSCSSPNIGRRRSLEGCGRR
jgi:putative transposase